MSRNDLHKKTKAIARIMTALGVLGAVLTVVLRVWVYPADRDIDTGMFVTNVPVIILTLVLTAALAALVFVSRGGPRQEVAGKPALLLSVMLLAVGAACAFTGVADIVALVRESKNGLGTQTVTPLQWLEKIFCLLGGVALVRLGLSLASESATRRGIAQWSLLAPVLWLWLVLANYEMSYASMVRLSDGFFTLMSYIFEMLFLFYFARYMAGVGKVGSHTLLFFSCGATLFAISAPGVKMIMYLMQDSEAYNAAGATGVLDLAVGLLALTVSIALCQSLSVPPAEKAEKEESAEQESVEWDSEVISVEDLVEGFEESKEQ